MAVAWGALVLIWVVFIVTYLIQSQNECPDCRVFHEYCHPLCQTCDYIESVLVQIWEGKTPGHTAPERVLAGDILNEMGK